MRNINGAHATGDDFFGREPELLRLVRTLLNDSVLLSAPRRVGKSSLILRLQQQGHFRAGLQQELGSIIRTFMESVGVSKPPVPGLDLPLGDTTVTATIRGLIDSLFSNIRAQSNSGRPIIAIDELPEFLLALE